VKGSRWRAILAFVVGSGVLGCDRHQQYSVWLVPSGVQYDSLRSLVCELAARYPSHCFIPHVTVVGDVPGTLDEITHRAETLARRTNVLEARLTSIEWTHGNYFRSFYVLIDETAAVSKLYDDTCAVIGKCQTRPYHMSMMYTDRLSDSARAAIRDSLYARGARTFGATVRLTRLVVCFTTGLPPEEWTCPAEIALH
jgi:Cyclic phosphodiesterase-like protein